MMRFAVYLSPAEEGGFVVTVPALPGCVTQGDSKDEAMLMAADAIRGYLESLKKHGEPVPSGDPGILDMVEVEAV